MIVLAFALVLELADRHGWGPCAARREGSSPSQRTKKYYRTVHGLWYLNAMCFKKVNMGDEIQKPLVSPTITWFLACCHCSGWLTVKVSLDGQEIEQSAILEVNWKLPVCIHLSKDAHKKAKPYVYGHRTLHLAEMFDTASNDGWVTTYWEGWILVSYVFRMIVNHFR